MIGELVQSGRTELAQASFKPVPREAHLLLGHVLGLSEAALLARWDENVDESQAEDFRSLLRRRLRGEPVAYLLGEREFYGRKFYVDSRVLIPRPETEHLIEAALEIMADRSGHPTARVLDLGTGSGCIAITLALEVLRTDLTAVDLSADALDVARLNATRFNVLDRVRFMQGDLAMALRLDSFDLIVCNPPYIGREEAPTLSPEVREFEPEGALFSTDGIGSMARRLLTELDGLDSGAYLVFEIGHLEEALLEELFNRTAFRHLRTLHDYQGIARTVVAQRI